MSIIEKDYNFAHVTSWTSIEMWKEKCEKDTFFQSLQMCLNRKASNIDGSVSLPVMERSSIT